MNNIFDNGPQREKAKERIEAIRFLNTGAYPKAELIMIVLGLKPATDVDLAPWNSSPEEFEAALQKASLSFLREDQQKEGWSKYIVAANSADTAKLSQLDPSKDHTEYGRLMGFPESAIKAFENNDLLTIEEEPQSSSNVFTAVRFSRANWQEELAQFEKWSEALRMFAPDVYKELKGE